MVRKRKNSEETAVAAPRRTRLRCNLEEEEDRESTLTETSSKSPRLPKTPSTGRKNTQKNNITANNDSTMSTRSHRVRVHKSSSDSDIENKGNEPERKMNHGEPLGIESYPTRSRTRKDVKATMQDSIISTAVSEAEPKRQTRKKRVLAAADNTLTENQSSYKTLQMSTRFQAKSVDSTLNPMPSPQKLQAEKPALNSPAELKNKKSSSLKRIVETPRKVSPRRQPSSSIKLGSDTVTPESSPILINLTPHRSTKTPKKSPMNIGSPKTHSQSPLRLSKTPRKLTVNIESPATSDKSNVSLTNQSPNRRNPLVVLTDFKKTTSPGMEEQLEFETRDESPPSFVSVTKLRLRKLPGKSKSATTSSYLTVEEANSPGKKSPIKQEAILGSKIRKSPAKTPAKTGIRQTGSATPAKRISTPTQTPKSPRRPKSTTKKRSPVTSSGTPLRPIIERDKVLSAKNAERSLPSLVAPKKIQLLMHLASSAPDTTPRGRIRRSLDLTPDLIKFSSGLTSTPILTPRRNGGPEESSPLKDVSLELTDSSKFMNVSDNVFADTVEPADGTYELSGPKAGKNEAEETEEIAEKTEVKDATYELAEPKTPSLRKKSRKRSLSNMEPDKCTPEAKRQCRVRFASPSKEKIPGSPLSSGRKSLPTVNTPAKQKVARKLPKATLEVGGSSRRRSRSLTKINESPNAKRIMIKRRSASASDLTNKTPKLNQSTQNSVNQLSRPRQSISSAVRLEIKLPVPRKVPNFAQIHQKKFAEMESLVDAKKRVAKRHEELNTQLSTRASQSSLAVVPENAAQQPSKKPSPTELQNGSFNRFGFKLRKAEAVKIVTKKPAAASRSNNHQESNRSILKGVRMNRRFELLMKARNIQQ